MSIVLTEPDAAQATTSNIFSMLGVFFRPTEEFLTVIARIVGRGGFIVDVGCGRGLLSLRVGERGINSLPLDLYPELSSPLFIPAATVMPLDGTTFRYPPKCTPVLARPCHGDFAEKVIARALETTGRCLYVGVLKNFDIDIPDRDKVPSAPLLIGKAGEDGEWLWIFGKDMQTVEEIHRAATAEVTSAAAAPADSRMVAGGGDTGVSFGAKFDQVCTIRWYGKETLVGIIGNTIFWGAGDMSRCSFTEPLDIVYRFVRYQGEDENDALDRIDGEWKQMRKPVPQPPCAWFGFVSPAGEFFPCGYCAHRGAADLIAECYCTERRPSYDRMHQLDDEGWLRITGGGLIVSKTDRWTPEQIATAKAIYAAFVEAEANDPHLERHLRENPENYDEQEGWSAAWNMDDDIKTMQDTIRLAEGDFDLGEYGPLVVPGGIASDPTAKTPSAMKLTPPGRLRRNRRQDGTPDGD